ncbi:MAG: CDP-glucose 4,6-dehydratase [Candidatus Micrarchaeia archaeon]
MGMLGIEMATQIQTGLAGFYSGKKVFLTGHTGFKGSWLVKMLDMLGAQVTGYALKPDTDPSLFQAAGIGKISKSHFEDIRDLARLKAAINKAQPEIVFHLAAQPLVRQSYADPVYTFDTNVMGTANVLEALRGCDSARAAVMITTDKVYENKELDYAYKETDRLGGYDPYSSSKACAELVISSYRNSFFPDSGCHIASARAGNVIGGGDWSKDRLIPDMVRSIYEGRKLEIRYPKSVRPWQHVLDPLNGYLMLGQKLHESAKYCGAYNFAPAENEKATVEQIIKSGISILGKGEYSIFKGEKPHEAGMLRLDASKARKELGWKPMLGTKDALRLTFEWYNEYYGGQDPAGALEMQIAGYYSI